MATGRLGASFVPADAGPQGAARRALAEALVEYGQGRHERVLTLLEPALRGDPGNALLWNLAGSAAKALGQTALAENCWRAAIAVAPSYAEAHYNLGAVLQLGNQTEAAIAAYRQALAHAPRHALVLNNLGAALQSRQQFEQALECYGQALESSPTFASAHHNRALVLSTQGRFDEAEAAVTAAIGLGTPAEKALFYRTLVSFKRFAPGDPALAAMERLIADPSLPAGDRMQLQFALGKAYGEIGKPEPALACLLAGNAEKRRQTPYDEAVALAQIERIREQFGPERFDRLGPAGCDSEVPVFIIGMPRSGGTLVEQILASHPQVHGAGECEDFHAMAIAAGLAGNAAADTAAVILGSAPELRRLGETYVASLRARAPGALRITDKNPKNFLHAGLIGLALPRARLIHVQRDPVDTCLSCFSQLFNGDYPYAYDLAELGRYWRAYDRLMAHWRSVLPAGSLLELRYEDLVEDLAGQVRRILAHCRLDWSEACLSFHRTRRPVLTASVRQVREPIYRSSLQRWRAYGKLLQPLLDALPA